MWWRLKSPASWLFAQPFVQTQIKENSKASRHWPLWPVTGGFPSQRASNAENVFIWWSHHDDNVMKWKHCWPFVKGNRRSQLNIKFSSGLRANHLTSLQCHSFQYSYLSALMITGRAHNLLSVDNAIRIYAEGHWTNTNKYKYRHYGQSSYTWTAFRSLTLFSYVAASTRYVQW